MEQPFLMPEVLIVTHATVSSRQRKLSALMKQGKHSLTSSYLDPATNLAL